MALAEEEEERSENGQRERERERTLRFGFFVRSFVRSLVGLRSELP